MKRFSQLVIASAVAAALAAPIAMAQQTAPRDGAGMPSGSPTQPGQHPRTVPDRDGVTPGSADARGGQDANEPRNTVGAPSTSPTQRGALPGGDSTASPDRRSLDARGAPQQRDAVGMPSGSPTTRSGPSSVDRVSGADRHGMGGTHSQGTVREAQQALQSKGYDVGPIDGIMGPKTASAVREFQQQQGLSTSGRLDSQTLSALNVSGMDRPSTRPGS